MSLPAPAERSHPSGGQWQVLQALVSGLGMSGAALFRLRSRRWRKICSEGEVPAAGWESCVPESLPCSGEIGLREGPEGFTAAIPVLTGDGRVAALLIAVSAQCPVLDEGKRQFAAHLAGLAATQFRLQGRLRKLKRARAPQMPFPLVPEASSADSRALEKTLELVKFGEDLRQLHRLSTATYETLDDLLSDYLETGRGILGLATGVVITVRGRFAAVLATHSSLQLLRPGLTFELDQVYCGLVTVERTTWACPDVSASERLAGRPHYGPVRQACYLGSPIFVDGEVYGVLSFSSPHPRWRPFSAHEVELIELMAKGVGRSVLELRMRSDRERAETLEQDRSAVLEMVAQDQSLEMVLDHVVRMVERQSPRVRGAVHVVRGERHSCAAAPSMPESYRRKMQNLPLTQTPGCALAMARSPGQPVGGVATRCAHEYCKYAIAASPIRSANGELLGSLIVYGQAGTILPEVDRELTEMAGSLIAIAIEHRRLTDRLAFQAFHDLLTGLPNRTLLLQTLEQQLEAGVAASVVFLDLDRFKQVNDRFGHGAGDAVLTETAARIRRSLRSGEMAARLGGDEFVIMLTSDRDEAVRQRARQLLDDLRAPIPWSGDTLSITASIGVASWPMGGITAEGLLGSADLAMYRAKNAGRNDICYFSPEFGDEHESRVAMEHALRQALERKEFQLQFQPIWQLPEAGPVRLDGFEVLLQWNSPSLGRVSPSHFIPIAEECGLIAEIGAWVLRTACWRAATWRRAGLPAIRLSVNVSPLQFARADFLDSVRTAIEEAGIQGDCLELELTESAIMGDAVTALRKIQQLRQWNIRLALDDFGTGYSSLSYLRWIPVDCLKIDRSFLVEIEHASGALAMVETIVTLAHTLGISVVAEGVETEAQLEKLRTLRCDRVQGHLFGGALPVELADRLLSSQPPRE